MTDDQAELAIFRASVRRFLDDQFVPHLGQWRKDGCVSRAFFAQAGAQGLLCPRVDLEHGGAGCDFRYSAVVLEEVARSGVTPASFAVHSEIVAAYIQHWGNDEQRGAILPAMIAGECMTAIAMTEPGAGSDLQAIATRARPVDGGYRISGRKTFITNGQNCDLVIVVATLDPALRAKGLTLFLVDASTPGFIRGAKLDKMGGREQDTSELAFDDMFVPGTAVLGGPGQGFSILMAELPTERLSLAVAAIAATETALAITIDYVKERRAFGKALIEFQNTGFTLAQLRAEIHMARAYVDRCIDRHVAGSFTTVEGAEAKLVTTSLQCRAVDTCLQLFGGYGWMDEYLISRLYTDARVQRIYGGTDEVLKLIIARDL